jgi:anaerobic magnesium-protoporphyrin IX monomethyl ester cyclase
VKDRKLRAIAALSLISGTALVFVSTAVYLLRLPSNITLPVLIVFSVLQYRLAAHLFDKIYKSRLIDIPRSLGSRFLPLGYEEQHAHPDVLLMRPPSEVLSGPDCGESLGLGYLASTLRMAEFKVSMLDARLQSLDVMQSVELVLAYDPPALGINLNFQYLAPVTADLLKALRQRGYTGHITLGGLYASVAADELLQKMPEIDTVVRFEGEETYLELLRSLDRRECWSEINGLVYRQDDAKLQVNPFRRLIPDLNTVAHPARDFLPLAVQRGGYTYIASSRGCKGHCTYCVQQRSVLEPAGKRWRGRDAKDIVDEIEACVTEQEARRISFIDDDFFGPFTDPETHAHRVAREIIARELDLEILISVQPRDVQMEVFTLLKKAGLKSTILSVDNFSPTALARFGKYSTLQDNFHSIEVLSSLEIDAYLGIIMFDPLVTLEELAENFKNLMGLPYLRPWQILSKLEIYYGSPITRDLDAKHILKPDGFFYTYSFADPRIENVYAALEIIIKTAYPAMAELDGFRWGNTEFSAADRQVIDHNKAELAVINREFNRSILEIALQVVQKQQAAEEIQTVSSLADGELQQQARLLSYQTVEQIKQLRTKAHSTALPAETAEAVHMAS